MKNEEKKSKKFCKFGALRVSVLGLFAVLALAGCDNDTGFTQGAATQYFIQDYNPEYLDVLWMVDDRTSTSFRPEMRTHLIQQASSFFFRLDQKATANYRMGIISADMQYSSPGALKPKSNPIPLTKNLGSLQERTQNFANIIGLPVNLQTSAINQGFASAEAALLNTFPPRAGVPLVMVFISTGDDKSAPQANAVNHYANQFLMMKNNDASLLRVYSINYFKYADGGTRCANTTGADIDSSTFQDRYFQLAALLGGEKADICTNFADTIDLSGLTMNVLPKRFKLDTIATADTLEVTVFDAAGTVFPSTWTFDAATNEIVFDVAPPAGTTIQVLYRRP